MFGSFDFFHFIHTVTVDDEGHAFVGGCTRDTQLPVLPSTYYSFTESSMYPNANVPLDGFVAMFKPNVDVLLWCTYFGGEAGPTYERIHTLCAKEHSLFAGGMTSKWNDVNSYFPLEPSVSPAYFDGSYNDIGSYPGDGFLTKFCSIHSRAMVDPKESEGAAPVNGSLQSIGDGWYRLVGQGTVTNLSVYDMHGRMCMDIPVNWTGEGTTAFQMRGLEQGAYMVNAPGVPSAKFVVVE